MIENALLGQSSFVGRDGFRWWIGQIAPRQAQVTQNSTGDGWGNRYKVRIMGYHPFTEEVGDQDLPYAQVMLPVTAGSGGGNYAQSPVLQPNDTVFGFFLDGDEAQVPMIIGHFGRTSQVSSGTVEAPYQPATAFTDVTPQNAKVEPDQSNEQNKDSQPSPSSAAQGQKKDQAGTGQVILTADTCRPNPISKMANIVENLGMKVEQLTGSISSLSGEISIAADIIEAQANKFVGNLMNNLFDELEGLGKQGLLKLYKFVYAKVFAATRSGTAAHLAGVAAQTALLGPVGFLQESLACVANKVVEGLAGTIEDLLYDFFDEARSYAGCAGAQFTGAFVNKIIDEIEKGMTGPLDTVAKIIAPGFKVADFLLGAASNLYDLGAFLDCNQSNQGKCPQDKEYVVGGSSREKGEDPFDYVMNAMNFSRSVGNLASDFERQYGKWDIFGTGRTVIPQGDGSGPPPVGTSVIPGGCYVGPRRNCTGPYIEIFGGGGAGAKAEVLMGSFIDNTPGLRKLVGGVQRTGQIVGAKILDTGKGYKYPPLVNFRDKCDIGYGAYGRAILGGPNDDQVVAIVIDNPGENYPAKDNPDPDDTGLIDVIVTIGGTGYVPTDRITIPGISTTGTTFIPAPDVPTVIPIDGVEITPIPDQIPDTPGPLVPPGVIGIGTTTPIFEIEVGEGGEVTQVKVLNILRFNEELPQLVINSDTGSGVQLRPVFGIIPKDRLSPDGRQVGIVSVIDCI